ncbi:hypothetical protein, partial [Parabacteroides distasonis]|uniref:hypothetical protein n=1 Tax=Parabacteroides distasonis TaxID=823 RepID=UPI002109C855
RSYEGVNRANIVIEKCPLLPEGTMSEELRDRYVAEAHFLRSHDQHDYKSPVGIYHMDTRHSHNTAQ